MGTSSKMADSQALALALRNDPSAYQLAPTSSFQPDYNGGGSNAKGKASARSSSAVPTNSGAKTIPAFLNKLYKCVLVRMGQSNFIDVRSQHG